MVICLALSSNNSRCVQPALPDSQWCSYHNSERIQLYLGYKARHAALDSFLDKGVCMDTPSIKLTSSLDVLSRWHDVLIETWRLLNRCILARMCFTERFYGDDMDFGHKQFFQHLQRERTKVEDALSLIESRARELLLASQNALWVLDDLENRQRPETPDCEKRQDMPTKKTAHHVKKRSSPKGDTSDVSTDAPLAEDPIDLALRHKCGHLQDSIRQSIASRMAPHSSIHYVERVSIVLATIRRFIIRDSALMLHAQQYTNVLHFIDQADLGVAELQRLFDHIDCPPLGDIQGAIHDILFPTSGPRIEILGGPIYKHQYLGVSIWPVRAWGHVIAMKHCFPCLRGMCDTVDDVISLTKFCTISRPVLANAHGRLDHHGRYPAIMSAFRLCGLIIDQLEDSPRRRVEKCNCTARKNVSHWEEYREEYTLCAALSTTDPKSREFINLCMKSSDFSFILRKGPSGPIIRSALGVWAFRTRHAYTRSGLSKADFSERNTYTDKVLQKSQPFRRVLDDGSLDRLEDGYQICLVDRVGMGSFEEFLERILEIWMKVYECEDVDALTEKISEPLFVAGEFEWNEWGQVVPNVEEKDKAYDILFS